MSLNGFTYDTATGYIRPTNFTSMPTWYESAQKWDQATATAWYKVLSDYLNNPPANPDPNKKTNFTTTYLWENRNRSVPKSGAISWPLAVSSALSKFIGPDRGSALANWLCGGYLYKGFFGLSSEEYDADDFIDAENCYSFYDPKIRISDCLLAIKSANVAAHDWVVRAASAKFANKVAHESIMYNKTLESEKKAAVNVAESAAGVVGDAATGLAKVAEGAGKAAGDTLSAGAWILSNAWWIAPSSVVLIMYIAWKSKATIAKAAAGAAVGGPVGAITAVALNGKGRK